MFKNFRESRKSLEEVKEKLRRSLGEVQKEFRKSSKLCQQLIDIMVFHR